MTTGTEHGIALIGGAVPVPVCGECGTRHPETEACDPWSPLAAPELVNWHVIGEEERDAAEHAENPAAA